MEVGDWVLAKHFNGNTYLGRVLAVDGSQHYIEYIRETLIKRGWWWVTSLKLNNHPDAALEWTLACMKL